MEDWKIILKKNFSNLVELLGRDRITSERLGEMLKVSPSTITNYKNENASNNYPSLEFIINLMNLDIVKSKYPFSLEDIVFNQDCDFGQKEPLIVHATPSVSKSKSEYLGLYYSYFLNQANGTESETHKRREFRYGVFQIFAVDEMNGENQYRVYARFYKDASSAEDLYLNAKKKTKENMATRELEELRRLFSEKKPGNECAKEKTGSECYEGVVTLTDDNLFINIESELYADKAQIIIPVPKKKAGKEYIGGLGVMNSVSHGSRKLPVGQKIILSREIVKAPKEKLIMDILSLHPEQRYDLREEADTIYSMFKDLYEYDKLELGDKQAAIENRLNQMMRRYEKKYLDNLIFITDKDDQAVYRLLTSSNSMIQEG